MLDGKLDLCFTVSKATVPLLRPAPHFLLITTTTEFAESEHQPLCFSTGDGSVFIASAMKFPDDNRHVRPLTSCSERTRARPRDPSLFHPTPLDHLMISRKSIARMIPAPSECHKFKML